MLKGFNRRVVVIKNTGSDIFDEAYFIIKENAKVDKRRGKRPVDEAKYVVNSFASEKNKAFFMRQLLSNGAWLALGGALGAIIVKFI